MQCYECKKSDNETSLERCRICFKYFCEDHAYNVSGRNFCTKQCAEFFFFADPDDDDD